MLEKLLVKDDETLRRILSVFSALDEIRWNNPANYNLINYCFEDLTPDEKLLTHWLCYITDRQTAFERIWEVGGYVLSYLVRTYTRGISTPEEAFFEHYDVQNGYLHAPLVSPNKRLNSFGILKEPVQFASRYMPVDAISIIRTLYMLDQLSQRSFARFLRMIIREEVDHHSAIHKMAPALHFLTYAGLGQVKSTDVEYRIKEIIPRCTPQISQIKSDPKAFIAKLACDFYPFGKKRLWCSIRDYLKSPEFNNSLVQAFSDIDQGEAIRWNRDNSNLKLALDTIELPGDVWNNNKTFKDGLFTPYLNPMPKSWDMPRTVREIYKEQKEKLGGFYPEQLDVTFDFIPRMCDRRECHICLFGSGIKRLCGRQTGLYCPVFLSSCGYIHVCSPNECKLKDDTVAGLCHSKFE